MEILENVPLHEHTTLGLGGMARFYVSTSSVEELREAIEYAKNKSLPIYILGGGSNVLFTDNGWNGLVIHIALLGRVYEENSKGDVRVIAQAGEIWDQLVEETVAQGLWGIENLTRIPGTVGAAPVQNIGAYGAEIKDVLEWVEVLDIHTLDLHILTKEECSFGYRDSIFKHKGGRDYIILRVSLRLSTCPKPNLRYKDLQKHFGPRTNVKVNEVRDAIHRIRAEKFPNIATIGTAGSFFKNPTIKKTLLPEIEKWLDAPVPNKKVDNDYVKVSAAWLLERTGWKGQVEGHVGCWDKHPLILVHFGEGTASELLQFVDKIQKDVQEKTNITLVPEVDIVRNE